MRKLEPINRRLKTFPLSTVKRTATFYNKAFHAKIFTLFASSESEVYSFSKIHKPNYDFCICFMKSDEGQWYLDNKSINKVRTWIINEAKTGTKKIFTLYKNWQKIWKRYISLSQKLKKIRLEKLSDKKLYYKFKEFYKQYQLVGSAAYIADSFMSTGEEDWLEKLVADELRRIGISKDNNITCVRKLTSPVHLSFTLEAEYGLLKIAAKINNKFGKSAGLELIKKDRIILKALKRHENKFHWIQNNYYNVRYITYDEFYKDIESILERSKSIEEALYNKEKELADVREEREKLISKLALSKFIKNMLEIARLFAKWKDIRKSGVYIGMHSFDLFLDEISKRTNYTNKELTYLIFDEIKEVINKKDMRKIISDREAQCFFAVTPSGYYITGGDEADKYFNILQPQENKSTLGFRGVVASPGHAKGRVRIIRKTEDMLNFQEGEILVANQTTPDFVPAMKKAAAIVTEQGGITSHAAIISRELKIPCIIGTKIATSALVTGEMIEVDAQNGVVKRLR